MPRDLRAHLRYPELAFDIGQSYLRQRRPNDASLVFGLSNRLDPAKRPDPARYEPDIVEAYQLAVTKLPVPAKLDVKGAGTVWIDGVDRGPPGTFDVILSSFTVEHFADPAGVLAEMRAALAPGGRLLVTFGPPWLAPSGSHMHFFTPVPWVHLLFAERTVMAVRARYRADGARRYEEVESGLNRMTVGRFERLAASAGLRMERRRYDCVKGIRVLGRAPLLRELFINNVACVLAPAAPVVPARHT